MKIRKLLCLLGFHVSPITLSLVPGLIWYNQRRNDAGYGFLSHKCAFCERWYETADNNEIFVLEGHIGTIQQIKEIKCRYSI